MDPRIRSIDFETQDDAGSDLPSGCLLTNHQSSSDEVHGTRSADLSKGSSGTQHPEACSSNVNFHEQSTISTNVLNQMQHRVAKWRHNARGRAWCRRLGMSASSWDGWAKLHVNPFVAMSYFFPAQFLNVGLPSYMCTGVRGEGHMYYVVLVPTMCHAIISTGTLISFWRWGPAVPHHRLYQPVVNLGGLCILPLLYMGFLGPEATIPWHNNLQWLVVDCILVFAVCQSAAAGGVPSEHPAEPRTSIMEPVIRSALHALMLFDALSDLAVTRSLLAAKQAGCWWFGQLGRCGAWNSLIATFIVAAGTDFSLVFIKILSGNENSNKSRRMQRLAYVMEMVCIVCELVIAVCTLVYLFSLQHSVGSGQEGHMPHRDREIALGFLSLAFTVAVLAVMAIGTDKLAQGGRNVWARVSAHASGSLGNVLPHGAAKDVNTSVGGVPVDAEDTDCEGQAMADTKLVAGSQIV